MTPVTLLAIAGTRPELLKLAPVIAALQSHRWLRCKTCFSGQHVDILDTVLGDVDVRPDVDLRMPPEPRNLSQSLAWLLGRLDAVTTEQQPAGIVVQGDTTSVLAGAIVAYHHQIPSFHVEAGLRTADRYAPFPEEVNRRMVSRLASLHFAPTAAAAENLYAEGIDRATVEATGNTGIDTLRIYAAKPSPEAEELLATLDRSKRLLLVTMHRRENLGSVARVTAAVRGLVHSYPDVEVAWILHKNASRERVIADLRGLPRVRLLEPLSYRVFVHLMKASYLVLTDSGGVQEEAPALGKPVLVLRSDTERPEGVEAGCAQIVGASRSAVMRECGALLDDPERYAAMARPRSPYGDGFASRRIVEALEHFYLHRPERISEVSDLPPTSMGIVPLASSG